MTKAEETLAAHGARIDNIEQAVGCIQPKLRAVEIKVSNIESKVTELHDKLMDNNGGRRSWAQAMLPTAVALLSVGSFMWYASSYLFVTRTDLLTQQAALAKTASEAATKHTVETTKWRTTVANTLAGHDRELQSTRKFVVKVFRKQTVMREDQVRLMTRMRLKPKADKGVSADALDKPVNAKSRLPPMLMEVLKK